MPDTPAEETGIAMADGYPVNHRLRAEALAAKGVSKDPAGHITDELIAETKNRVAAEAADAEAAEKAAKEAEQRERKELAGMPVDKLRELALAENAPVEADATKPQIITAIEAARAARIEG